MAAAGQQAQHRPITSGSNTTAARHVGAAEPVAGAGAGTVTRTTAHYAEATRRRAIEYDLENMLKIIFPDLSVNFSIHDSGNVIIRVMNNATEEVVREFPAENILDIIYNMTQRIGAITNKRL